MSLKQFWMKSLNAIIATLTTLLSRKELMTFYIETYTSNSSTYLKICLSHCLGKEDSQL